MSQISLQIKNRAKIDIGVRLNTNLREEMTQIICLATRHGNENRSIMLKKKVITNAQHPTDQNVYGKEDAGNKNDTLVLRCQDD